MLGRIIFVVLLCLPWGFFVTASDFLFGNAFGYVVIPAVIWWGAWRFGPRDWFGWIALGLLVSYLLSTAIIGHIDGAWDYFFKPLNQSIVMNIWMVLFASGVVVAFLYRWAFEKTRESA